MRFIHKVSKGSRFNQIYIPRDMAVIFEVGDLVEVKLLKKNIQLYYPYKFKIGGFKEKLVRELFSFLSQFKEIKQVFIAGSFLFKKIDYRDIDIIIVSNRQEEKFYEELTEKFSLKFHVIVIPEDKFLELIETCPLTRSMLYYSISNKKFRIPDKKINYDHIKFLLMMPQDLLRIKVNSRIFYDNIRRLITIERFLENKDENPEEIDKEVKNLTVKIYDKIKDNEEINEKEIERLREIIKNKLKKIEKKWLKRKH